MAIVIDFKTRQQRDLVSVEDRPAKLQIISWRDACEYGSIAEVEGCVLVGGTIPIELAAKFQALCEKWNAVA